MSCLVIIVPNRKLAMHSMLYGVYSEGISGELLKRNLRLFQAIALAHQDTPGMHALTAEGSDVVNVLLSPHMYHKGYLVALVGRSDPTNSIVARKEMYLSTYCGFERLSSKWAKEVAVGCKCVITQRISVMDEKANPLREHSVSVYF
jgi:hypothetical protein